MSDESHPSEKKIPETSQQIPAKKKKPYTTPVLEEYGSITNFTTGGSGRRSEFMWKRVRTGTGMNMMTEKQCVQTSMSMMRNTQRC